MHSVYDRKSFQRRSKIYCYKYNMLRIYQQKCMIMLYHLKLPNDSLMIDNLWVNNVFLTNACFYCVVNTNMNSMLAQFIKTLH